MSTWIPVSIDFAVEEPARLYGDREFLVVDDHRLTYRELSRQVREFSRGLLADRMEGRHP